MMSAAPTAGIWEKALKLDAPGPAESALGFSGFFSRFGARVFRFFAMGNTASTAEGEGGAQWGNRGGVSDSFRPVVRLGAFSDQV
jgi:hypothetical protein